MKNVKNSGHKINFSSFKAKVINTASDFFRGVNGMNPVKNVKMLKNSNKEIVKNEPSTVQGIILKDFVAKDAKS